MARTVLPELLDDLPPDDPRATASRADLRRVNRWMGQAGLMAGLLRRFGPAPPRSILELGCGDGTFMLRVARRLGWRGVHLRLADRQSLVTPATRDAFAALGWTAEPVIADVFDAIAPADAITANLFLHHFADPTLARLLARIAANTGFAAACEPRRGTLAALGTRLLFVIGCNAVTRHDAAISVGAGFTGQDLATLWPRTGGWTLAERAAGLFTHTFVAQRGAERSS